MKRSEVDNNHKIDFTKIYKDEKEFNQDLKIAKKAIKSLEKYRNKVIDNLYEVLEKYYEIVTIIEKAYVYGKLASSIDTLDTKSKKLYNKAYEVFLELSNQKAFIDDEIIGANWDEIENSIKNNPDLEKYRFMLDAKYRDKKHQLTENEEQLLNEYGALAAELEQIYKTLFAGEVKYPMIMVGDEKIEITNQNYRKLMETENRELRKEIYQKYFGNLEKYQNTFCAILNAKLKYDKKIANIRNFASPLAKSLYGYNIEAKIIDNLVKITSDNNHLYKKYNEILKKAHGVSKIYPYDIYYKPIQNDKKYSVAEAKDVLIKSTDILGKDYQKKLKLLFEQNKIDFYPTENKRTGAFQISSYQNGSFIFMNYLEKIDDISTLAHEAGHAVQSVYLKENNPIVNAECEFLITETASILNEFLLNDYVLKNTNDLNEKYEILNSSLDMLLGNFMMSMGRFNIKKGLSEIIQNGDTITPEEINKLSIEAQNKFEYNGMGTIPESKNIWIKVSHYYYNYYNYQYAVGIVIASCFINKILKGEAKDVENYIEFLKTSGSDYSLNTLKKYGIDLYNLETYIDIVEFIKNTLNQFEDVVNKLTEEQ